MQTIRLNLTLEELNTALEALGHMPYVRVYQLIAKIQQQAAPQLAGNQGAAEHVNPRGEKESEREDGYAG